MHAERAPVRSPETATLRLRVGGPPRFAVPDCKHDEPGRCGDEGCRYSLRPDWRKRGGLPAWAPACALEVAATTEGGLTLATVGVLLGGVTRERARQLEASALRKFARAVERAGMNDNEQE